MARGTEWLYEPLGQDKEEYLLGRRIDRHTNPASLVPEKGGVGGVVDLSTKVKEDPLFMIRKSEETKRKAIISNPVKVSQIKQLVAKSHKQSRKKRNSSPERSRSRSPQHSSHTSHSSHKRRGSPVRYDRQRTAHSSKSKHRESRRMDKEEMERKRQEMRDSARAYGKQRQSASKCREEEPNRDEHGPQFLQSLRVKSLSTSTSLGDRIHRNIQSVQRTQARLESDFL